MSRTLFGLRISPWTERARWALDHHKLAYTYHEHVPMIGEVLLRRKAKTKKASVPLLADDDAVVMGSLAIAKHAEKMGNGDKALFPGDKEAEINHWADVAEQITDVGRRLVILRMSADSKAQAESLPSFVPGGLRGVMAPTAGMAIRFLARKYDVTNADADALRPLLEETRAAIKEGGYVLSKDCFTFADIALASSLQVLRPRSEMALGPATREAWTNPKLADEFEDLVAWRDTVYAKHRGAAKN